LRPAIRHAIEQRRLVPGEYYVPVPSAPAGRDYWITRSEAARLLWETRRDWRARLHLPLYTLIALYTGARRGAILNLTWPQIDLARGIINFNPPGRAQTKKRRPIIRIPRSLLAALRRAHRRATCEYVIAYEGKSVASVKTAFNSAAERAGIPDCTSHTLRHTAGTWMAQRGVPMHQIAGYLGHSVARTTELYAHHHPDHMQQAVAALEGGSS
jgi:integrase